MAPSKDIARWQQRGGQLGAAQHKNQAHPSQKASHATAKVPGPAPCLSQGRAKQNSQQQGGKHQQGRPRQPRQPVEQFFQLLTADYGALGAQLLWNQLGQLPLRQEWLHHFPAVQGGFPLPQGDGSALLQGGRPRRHPEKEGIRLGLPFLHREDALPVLEWPGAIQHIRLAFILHDKGGSALYAYDVHRDAFCPQARGQALALLDGVEEAGKISACFAIQPQQESSPPGCFSCFFYPSAQ